MGGCLARNSPWMTDTVLVWLNRNTTVGSFGAPFFGTWLFAAWRRRDRPGLYYDISMLLHYSSCIFLIKHCHIVLLLLLYYYCIIIIVIIIIIIIIIIIVFSSPLPAAFEMPPDGARPCAAAAD